MQKSCTSLADITGNSDLLVSLPEMARGYQLQELIPREQRGIDLNAVARQCQRAGCVCASNHEHSVKTGA